MEGYKSIIKTLCRKIESNPELFKCIKHWYRNISNELHIDIVPYPVEVLDTSTNLIFLLDEYDIDRIVNYDGETLFHLHRLPIDLNRELHKCFISWFNVNVKPSIDKGKELHQEDLVLRLDKLLNKVEV